MSIEQITDGARDRREWDTRLKLVGSIFNTYGFGALGSSIAEPLLRGETLTIWNFVGMVLGITGHIIGVYLAPVGENDGRAR